MAIQFNEDYFKRQLARAKKAVTTPWSKLPAEGKVAGGSACRYCEFQRKCTGKRAAPQVETRRPKSTLIQLK